MIDFSNFQFPKEWTESGDFWSKLVREGGMPTSIQPWWQAQQQAAGDQITRAGKEAAESFGLGGLRYSTPLGQQISRIGAETTAGIMPRYWELGMQSEEAARNRQMTGAQALMGLGGERARLPMEVGERMLGMSGNLQQQQMAAMYPFLQEFSRMAPENSPWLQYGQNFPYGQFQQTPTQYQQSPFSQFAGIAAQFLPMLLGGGAGALPGLAEGSELTFGLQGMPAGTGSSTWNPWGNQ